MSKRFSRRRWRRPERLTLEHPPVHRRKDLGVMELVGVEAELGRKHSRRQIETLLGVYLLLCAAQGAVIALVAGLSWMLPVGFVLLGVLYFIVARELGDKWLIRALRARPGEGPRVNRLVRAESATAGIAPPSVLEVDGKLPNACSFALRRRWLVCTKGCEDLDELSLEGLLAHEVVHVRDGDAAVAGLYTVLAGGPDLVFHRAGVLCLLSIPLWPVTFVLRLLSFMAFAPDRDHRADIAAAMLTRYPPGVASALSSSGSEGRRTFRPFEPFWFRPVVKTPGPDPDARAGLLGEM